MPIVKPKAPLSEAERNKIKNKARHKKVDEVYVTAELENKKFTKAPPDISKRKHGTRVIELKPGSVFVTQTNQRLTLIHANNCRAHVKPDNDRPFDISPNTPVSRIMEGGLI